MIPKLIIESDRGNFEIPASDAGTFCPRKIVTDREELVCKNYGEFLGDETFVPALKFDLTAIGDGALIKSAKLCCFLKTDSPEKSIKEAYIMLISKTDWEGGKTPWSDMLWQFAMRCGVCEKDEFDVEENFDFEYFFQRVRFMYFNWAVREYLKGGNEDIPYSLIRTMESFIEAKGQMRRYEKNWHIGMGWYNEEKNQSLCAGWPRALDGASRLQYWAESLPYLTKTKYMNPENFCCILKYIRDGIYGIIYKGLTKPVSNLRMFEVMGALRALAVYPELDRNRKAFNDGVDIIKNLMFTVTMEDGTYREATGGYSQGVCGDFIKFIKLCSDSKIELPKEFHERFKKFVKYNMLIEGPGGENLQYGDQGAGKFEGWQFKELLDIYDDDELHFLLTRGDMGKEPRWKSARFPQSSVTVLRDCWKKDATYIFTQARGGGSHGHMDDNSITLVAGGRVLLCDAGIFTYTAEDPKRIWGTSPCAHNTVSIDDLPQIRFSEKGTLNEFYTDDEKDIISQTAHSYEGFLFTRKITWYKKKDIIEVEDEIIPSDDKPHSYRQNWHMLPGAKISLSKKRLSSNYREGAEVEILSDDEKTVAKILPGWYDYGYQQVVDNPYGVYEINNHRGKADFNTKIKILRH